MQPVAGQPAALVSPQPALVLPAPYARAIDDPNTALLEQIRLRSLRRGYVPALALVILGGAAYLDATAHDLPGLVYLGILIALVLTSAVLNWWTHLPQRRRGKLLLGRYGWRPVPARILADRPCLVRVALEGAEPVLRVRRLNWIGKQVVLRTGELWICGPDERGRALVRVAGSVGQGIADVTDARPGGAPPVPVHPGGPRPGEDPGLIRSQRYYHRAMVITVAIMVLLIGIGVGFLSQYGVADVGALDPVLVGWLFLGPVLLVLILWGYARTSKSMRRAAQAPYWQPVQVSLDTWDEPAFAAVRTGTGRVILPGGWRAYADFPRLSLDLAANLRATGVLWMIGDPVPGTLVPIGLPGYPLRGYVKIRR